MTDITMKRRELLETRVQTYVLISYIYIYMLILYVFLPAPNGREQQRCSALGPLCVLGLWAPHFSPPRPYRGSAATVLLGHLTATPSQ